MNLSDWLLALHLLAAGALVAGLTLFSAVWFRLWRADRPSDALAYLRLARAGGPLVGAGAGLSLVFGIWLAFERPGYHLWDGWILAAVVLWALGIAAGSRAGRLLAPAASLADELAGGGDAPSPELALRLRDRTALTLHVATVVAVVLILIDMIYKPGA